MSPQLFRQEAIDHQRFRIWGEVALSLPRSYAPVTSFIALSVLAMVLFVATHSYARKEHAVGFLVPTGASRGSVRPATERSLRYMSAKVSTSSEERRC